jgi:hypothetical protein
LTRVVVRDEDGKGLVDFKVYRDGRFHVESGPLAPVRFDVWRYATDAVSVYAGTSNSPVEFTLDARPDGPSDVMVKDTARQSTYRVQVTAEGEVISDEMGRPSGPDGQAGTVHPGHQDLDLVIHCRIWFCTAFNYNKPAAPVVIG